MKGIIRLIRPEQWWKNAFVFCGYLFSERASGLGIFLEVCTVALAFCLMSSCVYVFNDLRDLESDRQHEKKRNRPIASGAVQPNTAIALAFVLMVASLVLGWWVSWTVVAILVGYLLLNIAYTLSWKQIVILDVFCISAGFMLRIFSGTVGIGIPPSKWLLLCSMLITLFLGFVKRRSELCTLSGQKGQVRKVLDSYSEGLLDQLIAITVAGVIISYSLYTMSSETIRIHHTENLIYTVPFVAYALFRYLYLLHASNGGGDPSRELVKDPHILFSILAWGSLTVYFTGMV